MTNTTTVEIKSRWDGSVLFSAQVDASINDGLKIKAAVEIAVKAGAYLDGANLDGAYLDDKSALTGDRPIMQIGPIGSDSRYFIAYLTTTGLRLRAGCFFGTRDQFVAKLESEHGNNIHGQEYRAALALIDAHAALWTPVVEQESAA